MKEPLRILLEEHNEKDRKGNYNIYIATSADNMHPGIIGQGKTANEAIQDFKELAGILKEKIFH